MSETEFELDPETWLGEFYERRVSKNQDIMVLVADYHNRRGTGKTALSLRLAEAMDRNGGLTMEKVTMDPEELIGAYVDEPEGSALVLDESEAGLSKYRAGSGINLTMRKLVSMGRIEEKYVVLNAPMSAEIDRDLMALMDVWILVEARGRARVHSMGYNPYGDHATPKKRQLLEWGDIPTGRLKNIYDELTTNKREKLRGSDGDGYIERQEAEELVERAEEETQRETRDRLIYELYEQGYTQADIAALDSMPGRRRVGQILNEQRDEEPDGD